MRRRRGWASPHDIAGFAIGVGCLIGGCLDGSGELLALGGFIVGGWTLSKGLARAKQRRLQKLLSALGAGDAERARSLWKRVQPELDPRLERQSVPALIQAALAILSDDWQGAQQIFTRVPDAPGAESFRSARVRCLAELGEAPRAIALAHEFLSADDLAPQRRVSLQLALAVAHLRASSPDKALRLLDELLPNLPNVARGAGWLHRGDALRALGRESEARAAYAQATKLATNRATTDKARARLALPPPSAYR